MYQFYRTDCSMSVVSKYDSHAGLYDNPPKKEKHLFDVNDLVNFSTLYGLKMTRCLFTKCMRVQMSFLFLVYCVTGAGLCVP